MRLVAALLAPSLLAASAIAQAPTLEWRARYDGPDHFQDEPVQVARGADRVFVLARSRSAGADLDFELLAYSPGGALAWQRRFDGAAHSADLASALLADDEGGAFACGHTWDGSGWRAVLLRYDRDGALRWTRSFATPGAIDLERGPRLARAADGSLRMGLSSGGSFLVVAFEASGAMRWRRAIDVVPGADDALTALAVDASGNAIVAGPVGDGFGGYETIALDPAGELLWTENEFGDFGSTLGPAFVALDADGEVVVTGVPESSCGVLKTRTWRIDRGGRRLWTRSFPPDACDSAEAVGMELDAEGNAFVLCGLAEVGASTDFATLAYDRAGNALWRRTIRSPGEDLPAALAVGPAGDVYVMGIAGLGVGSAGALLASYAPDGALRWTRSLVGELPLDLPIDLAVGARGELDLVGASYFGGTNEDVFTLELRER